MFTTPQNVEASRALRINDRDRVFSKPETRQSHHQQPPLQDTYVPNFSNTSFSEQARAKDEKRPELRTSIIRKSGEPMETMLRSVSALQGYLFNAT
jgi:hypothetical protein